MSRRSFELAKLIMCLWAFSAAFECQAQEDAGKQSQNPIADLATLPIQNNWSFGVGPDDRTQFMSLVQPVIPLELSDRWNLITRPIMPFINSPIGADGVDHGLGDMQWQNFFVPVPEEPSNWTWGCWPLVCVTNCLRRNAGVSTLGRGCQRGVCLRQRSSGRWCTTESKLHRRQCIEGRC